jgi:hypothetical protein
MRELRRNIFDIVVTVVVVAWNATPDASFKARFLPRRGVTMAFVSSPPIQTLPALVERR